MGNAMKSYSTLFRLSLLSLGGCAVACYAGTSLFFDKLRLEELLLKVRLQVKAQAKNSTIQALSTVPEPGQAFELIWKLSEESPPTPSLTLCANRQTGLQLASSGEVTRFSIGDMVHYRIKPYGNVKLQHSLQVRIFDPSNWLPGCSGFSDGQTMFFGLDTLPARKAGDRPSGSYVLLTASDQYRWLLYSNAVVAGIPLVEWGNWFSSNRIFPAANGQTPADRADSPDITFNKEPERHDDKKENTGGGEGPDQPDGGAVAKEAASDPVDDIVLLLQSLLTDEATIQLLAQNLFAAFPDETPAFLRSFADQIDNLDLPGEYSLQTWLDILHWLSGHDSQVQFFVSGFLANSATDYDTFVKVLHRVEQELDNIEPILADIMTTLHIVADQDTSQLEASDNNHWQVLTVLTLPELQQLAQDALAEYQMQPEFVTAFAAEHGIELPEVYGRQTWVSIFQWLAAHPGRILTFVDSPGLAEMVGLLILSMGTVNSLAESKSIQRNVYSNGHYEPSR